MEKQYPEKQHRKPQLSSLRRMVSSLRIFPKSHDFFGYFQRSGVNMVKGTKLLCTMLENKDRRPELVKELKEIEQAGDHITHDVIDLLHHTFMTPFDRGDMHTLIVKMDDVLDFAYYVGNRLTRYNVDSMPPEMMGLAGILHNASEEISHAVLDLEDLKNSRKILDRCIKIKDFENQADEKMNTAIESIFKKDGWNAIDVIKIKELLENLEAAADRCEDVANVIEGIVLKYA